MSKISIIFKDRILSQHQLNKEQSFTIGSNSERDIYIDSLTFKDLHAYISTENSKYTFELVDDAEALLNNQEIKEPYVLKDGDNIEVGKFTLRFVEELEINHRDKVAISFESIKNSNKTHWLQFLNGKNVGKSIQLKQPVTNIGKAGTARLVITQNDHHYYVAYLDGNNNGKLDGQSIGEQKLVLKNNSTIELGQIKMLFYIEEK